MAAGFNEFEKDWLGEEAPTDTAEESDETGQNDIRPANSLDDLAETVDTRHERGRENLAGADLAADMAMLAGFLLPDADREALTDRDYREIGIYLTTTNRSKNSGWVLNKAEAIFKSPEAFTELLRNINRNKTSGRDIENAA